MFSCVEYYTTTTQCIKAGYQMLANRAHTVQYPLLIPPPLYQRVVVEGLWKGHNQAAYYVSCSECLDRYRYKWYDGVYDGAGSPVLLIHLLPLGNHMGLLSNANPSERCYGWRTEKALPTPLVFA